MSTKRTHFPRTTPDQRRLLFETWQATSNITKAQFIAEYNDRPPRGLAMPGLSPNEFAHRFWLL